MKRYIKVKGKWIDTLKAQMENIIYFVIKKKVLKWNIENNKERRIGHLQAQTDNLSDVQEQEAK